MSRKSEDNTAFAEMIQTHLNENGVLPKLVVDGWAGYKTRTAWSEKYPLSDPRPPDHIMEDDGHVLYRHAARDIGLHEVSGPGTNPRIKRSILEAALWLDPDDSKTPWCGCIMGMWSSECDIEVPSAYYRARNWSTVGSRVSEIDDASRGDIMVLSRAGGGHVGLYDSHDSHYVRLLGGNQSNQVSVARFPITSIQAMRRVGR